MNRMLAVAWREFTATAMTKGFIIGFVFMPVILFVAISGAVLLINPKGPDIRGTVAIIDQSPGGRVAASLKAAMTRESQQADSAAREKKLTDAAADAADKIGAGDAAKQAMSSPMTKAAMRAAMRAPDLTLEVLDAKADAQAEKDRVLRDSESGELSEHQRLAVIIVPQQAVVADEKGAFAGYELLVRKNLDIQVQESVNYKVREALIDARLAAGGFGSDVTRIRAMVFPENTRPQEVTKEGNKASLGEARMLMPMAFMFLLWIAVFTAGQFLLTTTIEEKSSRVMEVLLSAVSSRELMVGKIIGQMAVGLVVLGIYSTVGVGALVRFQLGHLMDYSNLVYLGAFFLIAFFLIAALMAAIGSAVNDMREAQSLMTPVMFVLMIPMLLWMPITRDPNSTFSTVLSIIPPTSPFAMMLRIPAASGSTPVPTWQIALSIALGFLAVVVVLWAAAKIFRIGVLMYGKPPNFGTLIKWIRMA